MKFFVVDAFTNEPFKGNPAGVVVLDKSENLTKKEKQLLAGELRFSETAFVKQNSDKEFVLEYFTPVSEIDLCGHATIATFCVLKELGFVKSGNTYIAATNVGKLKITLDNEIIFMEQAKPELGEILSKDEVSKISEMLGIDESEINVELPLQIVSTGVWDLLIPVKTEKALFKISPNFEKISKFCSDHNIVSFHVFTLDTKDGIAKARDFAPLFGINEEAATGTANGALSYYLYNYKVIEKERLYKIIQGESMSRRSEIYVKIEKERVLVGGKARIIVKGVLEVK
ncbi:MAG: PhzF family phenazine biosynthesis protein [Thermosipho sp. (in: Bacteria)]|nr:PhzF family phenazine biosynthesis protein [Thermosipho sp. (in: thermotogales)]